MDVHPPIRYRRRITGMSAVLLPLTATGDIDWTAFRRHLARTAAAGLVPAVNMDTGYGHLLDDQQRQTVLQAAAEVLAGRRFLAGTFVADQPGEPFAEDTYRRRLDEIATRGGTPIICQSFGLTRQPPAAIVASYERLAGHAGDFYAFELGTQFAPFGAIYDIEVFEQLLRMPRCLGAKHSSLSRQLEWQRLTLRDHLRPDFQVLTGNDLAIDMVIYGSDYLLGLSTFAPEEFARRDAFWLAGDNRFHELNDVLQYLGCFAFRQPVPAYKHSAAQFLRLRGWIAASATFPGSPQRPESDVDILHGILDQLAASA